MKHIKFALLTAFWVLATLAALIASWLCVAAYIGVVEAFWR